MTDPVGICYPSEPRLMILGTRPCSQKRGLLGSETMSYPSRRGSLSYLRQGPALQCSAGSRSSGICPLFPTYLKVRLRTR